VPRPNTSGVDGVVAWRHVAHGDKEWLLPFDGALSSQLRTGLRGLPRDAPLLELGCGTSDLAAKLVDDGWRNVTAIDISPQAVVAAIERHGFARQGLRYMVGDARRLDALPAAEIGAVIDKGTLDAICCGDGFDYEARTVLAEVRRVLAPGGRWLCLSLMPPSVVMPLLQRHEWSSVHAERVHGLTLYCARRSRWGAPMTRWHWHPVEGGWHTRVESARAL